MVHTVAGGLAGGIELALMYPTEYGPCSSQPAMQLFSSRTDNDTCSQNTASAAKQIIWKRALQQFLALCGE